MRSRPSFRSLAASALFLLILLVSSPACGEDAYYSGEPRLRVKGAGSVLLTKTAVRIENFNVNVKYSFKNLNKKRVPLVFSLDAPLFGNREENSAYPDRSYADLIMSLDGKRVSFSQKAAAYLNDRDVTPALEDVGLKPSDLSRFESSLASQPTAPGETLARLRARGFADANGRPLWRAKYDYEFQTEVGPRNNSVFQYVYSALPGIFYIAPEDNERREVVRLMGAPWKTIQTAFGGASGAQGFNILRVMQLPLWADSWLQPAEQLEIHISMSPVGDRNCLLALLLDGQTYSGEGSLRLVLNKYHIKGPVWLAVFSPFGVH